MNNHESVPQQEEMTEFCVVPLTDKITPEFEEKIKQSAIYKDVQLARERLTLVGDSQKADESKHSQALQLQGNGELCVSQPKKVIPSSSNSITHEEASDYLFIVQKTTSDPKDDMIVAFAEFSNGFRPKFCGKYLAGDGKSHSNILSNHTDSTSARGNAPSNLQGTSGNTTKFMHSTNSCLPSPSCNNQSKNNVGVDEDEMDVLLRTSLPPRVSSRIKSIRNDPDYNQADSHWITVYFEFDDDGIMKLKLRRDAPFKLAFLPMAYKMDCMPEELDDYISFYWRDQQIGILDSPESCGMINDERVRAVYK